MDTPLAPNRHVASTSRIRLGTDSDGSRTFFSSVAKQSKPNKCYDIFGCEGDRIGTIDAPRLRHAGPELSTLLGVASLLAPMQIQVSLFDQLVALEDDASSSGSADTKDSFTGGQQPDRHSGKSNCEIFTVTRSHAGCFIAHSGRSWEAPYEIDLMSTSPWPVDSLVGCTTEMVATRVEWEPFRRMLKALLCVDRGTPVPMYNYRHARVLASQSLTALIGLVSVVDEDLAQHLFATFAKSTVWNNLSPPPSASTDDDSSSLRSLLRVAYFTSNGKIRNSSNQDVAAIGTANDECKFVLVRQTTQNSDQVRGLHMSSAMFIDGRTGAWEATTGNRCSSTCIPMITEETGPSTVEIFPFYYTTKSRVKSEPVITLE